jgi:hypothetical protein
MRSARAPGHRLPTLLLSQHSGHRNISAIASNAQAVLTSTTAASSGGTPITAYTITGLTDGAPCNLTITAINSVGTSTASGASTIVVPVHASDTRGLTVGTGHM